MCEILNKFTFLNRIAILIFSVAVVQIQIASKVQLQFQAFAISCYVFRCTDAGYHPAS